MEIANQTQVYLQAVKTIKETILKSRYNAAKHVNKELLLLYYNIGKYVSKNSRKGFWGTNAINIISQMLQQELPGLRGFSEKNIKNMRMFFEQWQPYLNRQIPSVEIDNSLIALNKQNTNWQLSTTDLNNTLNLTEKDLNQQMPYAEITMNEFFSIGFTFHIEILSKTKTLAERLFYIHKCATEFWTVTTLRYHIKENLFTKDKNTIKQTNFNKTISNKDYKQKALQSFKDEYMLDFINIEDEDEIDESQIEQSIIKNIKNFIMAFGPDFTFLGNQYRLEVAGKEYRIDLLFFSRRLRALVAFELKRGEFKPEYTGKLNFYLAALDKYVKLPDENASIGIILCKSKNEEIVELSFSDTSKPMGVATYRTSQELPKALREALPDIDELKKLLK